MNRRPRPRRRRAAGLLVILGGLAGAAAVTVGFPLLPAGVLDGAVGGHSDGSAGSGSGSAASGVRLPATIGAPTLACPGPATLLVPDGASPVDPGGPVLIRALVGARNGGATATLKLLGKKSAAAGRAAEGAGTGGVEVGRSRALVVGADGPGVVSGGLAATALGPAVLSASESAGVPALAAVQSTLARSGELRALTAGACTSAAPETWLVGGSTERGRRLRLLLANPTPAPAVVDIAVYGPSGRVKAPSGDGVVVGAGAEVPVLIDALAPDLPRVAVRVSARSGQIRASLHDSLLRGLVPGGADDVAPAAAPARTQLIPGISLTNGFSKTADDAAEAGSTALRIAVPGPEEAVVRVRLLNSSGALDVPDTAVVTVPAGTVSDVPIAGVASGTYAAVLDADVPIVAGAVVGRAGRPGRSGAAPADFGWAAAAEPIAGPGNLALPVGARCTLSLVAARGAGSLQVREVDADGELGDLQQVTVPDGTSATVQVSPDAVGLQLDGVTGAGVAGALVATVEDPKGTLISVLPVAPGRSGSDDARLAVQDPRLGL